MQIDNPEALKAWLTHILEPICEADPAALARYVLALLKKDKAVRELSQCMSEQLDVFLGAQTAPFLARLFDSIASEEYLKFQPIASSAPGNALPVTSDAASSSDELSQRSLDGPTAGACAVAAAASTHSSSQPSDNGAGLTAATSSSGSSSEYAQQAGESAVPNSHDLLIEHASPINSPIRSPLKPAQPQHSDNASGASKSSSSHNNHRDANHHSSKHSSSSDSRRRRISARSRSRSPERHRDSGKSSTGNGRGGRNKSPGRSYDRRGGGGSGRSWKSRSRSPIDRRAGKSYAADGNSAPATGDHDKKPSSAVAVAGGAVPPPVAMKSAAIVQPQRQRCRDFDEKGYCMRGETCPWDHGVDPLVLEDISNPTLMTAVPHGGRGAAEYSPDEPELWTSRGASVGGYGRPPAPPGAGIAVGLPPPPPQLRGVGPPGMGGYARGGGPNNAPYRGPPGVGPPGSQFAFALNGPNAVTPLQRELIAVPVLEAAGNGAAGGGALAHGGHHGGAHGGDISAPMGGNHHHHHNKRRYDPEDTVAIADAAPGASIGPPKRKIPISGRLGPRVPSIQQNCSLELRKVPRGLNSIAHLNNHFSKFGKIVNIQISYDGDAEAAIVTFSTHAEANVAYRSTEAVLNNRFIKVFWHSAPANGDAAAKADADGGASNAMSAGANAGPPHLRHKLERHQYSLNNTTNNQHYLNNNGHPSMVPAAVPTATAAGDGAADINNGAESAKPTSAVGEAVQRSRAQNRINRVQPNVSELRRKQEDNVKAAVQLAHGLHKRKHDLLQEYLKQMRSALELVERTDNTDGQRQKLLETIKTLQSTIDKLNKEIAAEQATMQAQMQPQHHANSAAGAAQAAASQTGPATVRRTKEQHKKELLDIELELFAQQQEGNDTTQLQKRIEELQRSLGAGIPPKSGGAQSVAKGSHHNHHSQQQVSHHPYGGGNGAPGGRPGGGRVRPAPPGSTSVDRRPTTLRVAGFNADDADTLLGHFKHFGEVTRNELDKEVPELVIAFATRINAEQAMLRGRTFKDSQLQISWVSNPCVPPPVKKAHLDLASEDKNSVDATTPPGTEDAADSTASDAKPQHGRESAPAVVSTSAAATSAATDDGLATQPDGVDELELLASDAELLATDGTTLGVNSEEVLLPLEDEEEEEDLDETEDRSWRR